VSESVGFGSFPPSLLCVSIGTDITVTLGTGWPIPVSSDNAVVLLGSTHSTSRSIGNFKANSFGVANLQATWEPPFGSAITSVQWSQTVKVVPSV